MSMRWMGKRWDARWRSGLKSTGWGQKIRWFLLPAALLFALLLNTLLPSNTSKIQPSPLPLKTTPIPSPISSPTSQSTLPISSNYTPPIVSVWNATEKKVMLPTLEEYLIGVVAAEMPASFDLEALKAQAVAARTYTVRQMRSLNGAGCDRDPQADICTDSTHCQAWLDEIARRKNWGANQDVNEARIREAVTQTAGQIVVYDGQPIVALFHATSNGRTENVEEVYAQALPYLRSVQSSGEETAPRYEDVKTFTYREATKRINRKFPSANVSASKLETQLEILSYSEGGRVKSIQLGKQTATGRDIRSMFELDSTSFKMVFENGELEFHTTGYGHGVGMSQTGAQAMAQSGAKYIEILTHYYTDTSVVSLDKINH